MFTFGLLQKVRNVSFCLAAFSVSSFCQANSFADHPEYNNFKANVMGIVLRETLTTRA